ncbi:DUF3465 domain-containing protein [Acinetobacter sp. 187]|uniref:DUF3465 domain-containing protein n=1 Tax=Acinetobacter lanii TaxID=2715163 RepID=UPI00140B1052|nr:DUF3465 domain-containing protein [Acinetobacter lanii]NHC02439.1 DUF3465 domain-containing protein [Acinetobacter lanii]
MANKKTLSIGALIVVVIAAILGIDLNQNVSNTSHTTASSTEAEKLQQPNARENRDSSEQMSISASNGLQMIREAFDQQRSDIQVMAKGRVKAILKDDNEGSRHQKFILSLDNGLTVLVAHNIDLAPRIENLSKGNEVQFYGEYEYSEQGGVIHWTHRDPQNRHISGWLKHQGKTYQ